MCKDEVNPFCEYKSTRFIRVRNRPLVVIYYSLITCVLIYIVVYTVWIAKGYQQFDEVVGTSSAKVKGTGSTGTGGWQNLTVFDAVDIVSPSTEQDAVFITTSQILTNNQTRGLCLGNDDVGECVSDNDCKENEYNEDSQGILTGICGINGYCQVKGWCPLENDTNPTILNNLGNFTVFIKVDIRFAAFDVQRTNTLNRLGNGAPKFGYNLFTVNEILNRADKNITSYLQIAEKGAMVLATSQWNCNLDKGRKHCNPNWNFQRIDNQSNTISRGYNFRTVDYNVYGDARRLRKLMGLRIIFAVDGQARKFSFAALSVTFGAGLAYLGVASFIADIVLEKFLPESEKYDMVKNQYINKGDEVYLSLKRKQEEEEENSKVRQSGSTNTGYNHLNEE